MGATGGLDRSAAPPRVRSPLLLVGGADRQTFSKTGRPIRAGMTDLWQLLGERTRFDELHLDPRFLKQPGRPDFRPYRCLLNIITDPDQNKEVLVILRKLLREFPGRVLNHPDEVLKSTRDQVAARLAGIPGLRVPRTIRLRGNKPRIVAAAVEQAGLHFPIIVRVAGTHMGQIVGVVGGMDELLAALTPDGQHILTEFVDFRSDDGLYRKYRIYFFGPQLVFRHMIIFDQWNIHVKNRYNFMCLKPPLMQEEIDLLERPEGAFPPAIHEVFQAVRARMTLDFFGMDFGIMPGGEVLLFEANATMNYFPLDERVPYIKRCLPPGQQAFRNMVRTALRPG